ncbi:nuclear transport factor 2 family protein [Aestuariivita sp.]|uniref:nuclear transport factor 2 family protein n=1 Tax=Aestuariivita sp. TaxID=1872407 RepID=UPI00216FB01A|nr:nuclear transport factor 2 family protein [Aestuariivita sp.]MCE8006212.1 nuclear transport factor 2 family protein [Aestuariivita sp.]
MTVLGPLARQVAEMEAALGQQEWGRAAEFLSPDIRYVVGGQEPRYGIAGIRDYMAAQSAVVEWVGHDLLASVETADMVVIEVISRFCRVSDRRPLALPCTDIYRFGDGVIRDWRVYADLAAIGLGRPE